jgi:hypothetical protein
MFKQEEHDLWCVANHYAGYCRVLSKYIDENKFVIERHPDCPLIEIPTPHGRLIDADAVNRKMDERIETLKDDASMYEASCVATALEMFAPTVIEAEE